MDKKIVDAISNIIQHRYFAPVDDEARPPWDTAAAEVAELLSGDAPEGPYGLSKAAVVELAADAIEDAAEAVSLDSGSDIVDRHSASGWLWLYANKLRNSVSEDD